MGTKEDLEAAGILPVAEPYESLDEMHADEPHAPADADPFSPESTQFADDGDEAAEMTIDKDGVVRRNGEIEADDDSTD